jgi:hypothetical protein
MAQTEDAERFRAVQDRFEAGRKAISLSMQALDFESALEECERLLPLLRDFVANATSFADRAAEVTCQARARLGAPPASSTDAITSVLLLLTANCLLMVGVVATKGRGKVRVKVD